MQLMADQEMPFNPMLALIPYAPLVLQEIVAVPLLTSAVVENVVAAP